jgi:hypothetical protein
MWQRLWQKWTIDKPAAFGDWLWDVFVVQLAAALDRLTWRRVVAILPLIFLIVAYAHRIAVPPEVVLIGDFLAYIDIVSVLFLVSVLSRMSTVIFLVKNAISATRRLAGQLHSTLLRPDARHGKQDRTQNRTRLGRKARSDDDDHDVVFQPAWA